MQEVCGPAGIVQGSPKLNLVCVVTIFNSRTLFDIPEMRLERASGVAEERGNGKDRDEAVREAKEEVVEAAKCDNAGAASELTLVQMSPSDLNSFRFFGPIPDVIPFASAAFLLCYRFFP
jgi:hypothetical protein